MNLRTVFFLSLIATLVGLSACSTSNDVISERGIQKRKYRKGFYVSHPGKQKHAEPLTVVSEVETPLPCGVVDRDHEAPAPVAHPIHQEEGSGTAALAHPSIPKKTEAHSEAPALELAEATPPQRDHRVKLQRSTVNTALALAEHSESADDTELLLYIILSILLPPLAVYLLYGISTNFWISVILTILLWIPGVIFALIHVLNRKG
ncbi:MAG: YqaE/Pmp3 family membrane protein [Flavobacteriales bacterium]